MGLFGWGKKQPSEDRPPQRKPSSDDPVESLLATYDPKAELSPSEAADLGAKLRAIHERNKRNDSVDGRLYSMLRRIEWEASYVRGKPIGVWIPTLDELRSSGDDDTALPLLLECIEAAERAARVNGMEPAPGYTRRAAVIYRRRKDYAREIEVMERWESVSGHHGHPLLSKRLAAAKSLRQKDLQ
jgi:hypothetical protein